MLCFVVFVLYIYNVVSDWRIQIDRSVVLTNDCWYRLCSALARSCTSDCNSQFRGTSVVSKVDGEVM